MHCLVDSFTNLSGRLTHTLRAQLITERQYGEYGQSFTSALHGIVDAAQSNVLPCSQDPDKFKSRMQSLNYGNVMEAAARDYAKVLGACC